MTDASAGEPDDDIDLTHRHLTQRFPDELARALLPDAQTLTEVAWEETQVTARQRRMDRGLRVIADGIARIEHVEWQLRWELDLPYRMYEYQCLQAMGLREATPAGERPPRMRGYGGAAERPRPPVARLGRVPHVAAGRRASRASASASSPSTRTPSTRCGRERARCGWPSRRSPPTPPRRRCPAS